MVLGNLAILESNSDPLIQNGVIDCITAVLGAHGENNKIAIQAFRTLSNLALISEEYRKLCLEKGCVESVQGVIKKSNDGKVLKEGKETITYLTTPHSLAHEQAEEEKQ